MHHQIRFTLEKISRRLKEIEGLVYQNREPIPPFLCRELDQPGLPLPELEDLKGNWSEVLPGSYWILPRKDFALKTTFKVPADWKKDIPVALHLPIGNAWDFSHPEALVYLDGKQYASCDRHHQEVILPKEYRDGKNHTLMLIGWTGIGGSTMGDMTNRLKMGHCEVVQIHPAVRSFLATARVTAGILEHLDHQDPTYHHLVTALDEALKIIDLRLPIGDQFYTSIPQAHKRLQNGFKDAGAPLDVDITAIGHAHIDIAWLWTLAQARQKSRRSFTNVLRLMENFPSFSFTQSQPQLYEYLIKDDPELFQDIKDQVEDGRWEPIGGMWVEADCNISGGESLVRQFLLGRQFFQEHFGKDVESPVLWLPDVFGYAWNLPQLIKEAGLEYFFTIKIGWSQYNRLPFDSFWWQGLDGTRVLTHFSTTKNPESAHASTYNADASPGQILGTWLNFQNKDDAPPGETLPLLMSYGWGDGGGGPTREMIENILELEKFPGAPRVKPGKVIDFYRQLEKVSDRLPIWNGELYLEFHRGTYTTQARNKRANRKMEFALHDAEFLAATASLFNSEYQYPHEILTKAWKLVCLNQFHDILPGSSIAPVYKDSLEQYQEVEELAEQINNQALEALSGHFGSRMIINPTSFERDEPVCLDGKTISVGALEPYSISPLSEPNKTSLGELICRKDLIENDFLRIEINSEGDISRIYDKQAAREVLPEGTLANQWIAFEDRPLNWDAWDIDIFYDDKSWLAEPAVSIKVLDTGPLRAVLEIKRQILSSIYTQRISLDHNSARLDFDTEIDWQERKILLKAAFPMDILSPTATYEIQWGNVERPTHQNTSWDWARFETAAQKWVDLSEGDYGVSLINDCKYGHDIRENTIRLTLLRGTTAPDPDADLGIHHFKYSLFPHRGSWDEKTIKQAYVINNPLLVRNGESKQEIADLNSFSLVSVDQPQLIIETVKIAEDGEGLIIRLYETRRSRGNFTLRTGFIIKQAWQTNILEENKTLLETDEHSVSGSYRPYQIITLRIIPEIKN